MPKRKNEQTLAEKAFKKARDDELERFLEGCLKNYKEGKMTSDDVTNGYYEKLISFKIGMDAISTKFTELKKIHSEIKHPEKNNETRLARKHEREDYHHANPAVIDTTLLLEKAIQGLEYALEKKLYPQVQFCLSFLVCTRPQDLNCNKIRVNGSQSSNETNKFLHDISYKDDTILATLANLMPSKQYKEALLPPRLVPFICDPKHYGLVMEGFNFLQEKENIDRACYGGKKKYLAGCACGPENVKSVEWNRKIDKLMIENLGLLNCVKNPEKCEWFKFTKTNGRHFTACAMAQGILNLDDDIMPNAAFRNALGHEIRSPADHSYDNIKCTNIPKYDNILVKKIDPNTPLVVNGKQIESGHYVCKVDT